METSQTAPAPAHVVVGDGPLVATAIHDGHAVRPELQDLYALTGAERLREEDPFTGRWTTCAPTRVVGLQSRFEVDLNRPSDGAVYIRPEQAWGLRVWKDPLPAAFVERSLAAHATFYDRLGTLLDAKLATEGHVVVYDLHSYNHRRDGPAAPPADAIQNPEVNLGTATLPDRSKWATLIDRFAADLSAAGRADGSPLDVRENVKFKGGYLAQWVHRRYPGRACVLSIEFKKFFMDEWTGKPFEDEIAAIGRALTATTGGVRSAVQSL